MMFPDRAPNDQHLFTTFVGGSHNRDLAGAPTYGISICVECYAYFLGRSFIFYTSAGLP
jgi:hypothetical protein